MSASQEKRRRKELREQGVDKRIVAQQEQQVKRKKEKAITSFIAALVVVLLVVVGVFNSNLFYKRVPAVTINGENYNTAEFNYFYYTNYYSFVDDNESIVSYLFDQSKPLDTQQYSEDQTWQDYFQSIAIEKMREVAMLYDKAMEAGFELSQDSKDEIEVTLSNFESYATLYGYPSVNKYLANVYGKGSTLKSVEKLMTKAYIANEYYQEVIDSYTYTDEELVAYYQGRADEFDTLNYRYYLVSGSADEAAGIDEATAMANAKETAELIAAAKDESEFAKLVYDNAPETSKETYKDEESTLYSTVGSSLNEVFSEWLLAGERTYGDTTVAEGSTGYYVVMYVSRENNDYAMKQVRHILVSAEADEEGNYTDEAKAVALKAAEDLYAQWKSGEATEESFAELAKENSDDTGSAADGGLYDKVYKGMTVEEFDAFCFDESRKPGDTGIVYGERINSYDTSGNYAGYHIIYYVGEGQHYNLYIADSNLRYDDFQTWQQKELESYTSEYKFAINFAM